MNEFTTHVIYRIVCFATGKLYIGRSLKPDARRAYHFSALANNNHPNIHLQRAYNKWGRASFYFEIIETNVPQEEISAREQYWITYYESYGSGFNATPGGDGGGENKRRCTWNDIEYESISAAARALKISVPSMHDRIKRGYVRDSDLKHMVGESGNPCTWNGIKYNSIAECARALGVSRTPLRNRLKRGYRCDSDMIKPRVAQS